jgi:hypothetical protein
MFSIRGTNNVTAKTKLKQMKLEKLQCFFFNLGLKHSCTGEHLRFKFFSKLNFTIFPFLHTQSGGLSGIGT